MKRRAVLAMARDARVQLASDLHSLGETSCSSLTLWANWTVRELASHLVVVDERLSSMPFRAPPDGVVSDTPRRHCRQADGFYIAAKSYSMTMKTSSCERRRPCTQPL